MRRPERIPIFLEKIDTRKLSERWHILEALLELDPEMKDNVEDYWKKDPDQRYGQVLINLQYVPDDIVIWNDEEDSILRSQGIPEREYKFWGRNFDKDMNKLPKTEWILIKDLTTDHIQAIVDGGWADNPIFEEELELRKQLTLF